MPPAGPDVNGLPLGGAEGERKGAREWLSAAISRTLSTMRKNRRSNEVLLLAAAVLMLASVHTAAANDEPDSLSLRLPERIRISERSNLSTRVNGRYVGLLTREVTGHLSGEEGMGYAGRFFLYEKMRRDADDVGRLVDQSVALMLDITPTTLFDGTSDYPYIQGLLRAPRGALAEEDTWEAPAWITINPRHAAEPLRLPVVVSYTYMGREMWNGDPTARIEAEFDTVYPLPRQDNPDAPVVRYTGDIVAVRGNHAVTLMVPDSGTQIAFIRDTVTEQYLFADGNDMLVQGHVLLFLSGTMPGDGRISEAVEERLRDEQVPDVTVDRTEIGVRLTIDALRFRPDQAVLLPEERTRLDSVAHALRQIDGVRYLVVGHTADVGTPEGRATLSVERAQVIAGELARRGISPDRIDIEGRGSAEPVATNETEEGRARNRRVEIYVIEN